MKKMGRPMNARRAAIIRRFDIDVPHGHAHRLLPMRLVGQVERCVDDSARRLILGISRKYPAMRRAA